MPRLTELLTKMLDKLGAWAEASFVMLPNFIVAILVLLAGYFISGWVRTLVRRLVGKLSDNAPISELLATLARVGVNMVAVFIALGLLELERTVTSLLAGVGVVGLALGFAFQDIAANFMSGMLMALRRPFVVGDLVEVAGVLGKVKRVALRATEIETIDGLSVLIPNKDIFQAAIINYTHTRCRRLDVDVGVAYCEDLERVQELVIEAVQGLRLRDEEREVEVFFHRFGDSSIDATARIWLLRSDQGSYSAVRSDAIIAIKRAFDREGIAIPFPIRTLDFGAAAVGGERLHAERCLEALDQSHDPL